MSRWNITWERVKTKDISGITPAPATLYSWDIIHYYNEIRLEKQVYTTSLTPSVGDTLYDSTGTVLSDYTITEVSENSITVRYSNVQ